MTAPSTAPYPTQGEYTSAVTAATNAATVYYDSATVLMADAEYDNLLDRITATETIHPDWTASGGLLTEVAGGASKGGDVPHRTRMLSLGKISYDAEHPERAEQEVRAFAATISGHLVGEPKLDGLAVNATYDNGLLVLVALRGDGTAGENVTAQAQGITGLPVRLTTPWNGEIRGEVYMSDSDFKAASAARVDAGKAAFVNPRNAVAGSIRNIGRTYLAPMSFGGYDIVGEGVTDGMTHTEAMAHAASLGFGTATALLPSTVASLHADVDTLLNAIHALEAARATLGYPIDGFVIKANDPADRERLGARSNAPRYATAYKYAPEERTSVLRGVARDVGKTGVVSLAAVIAPVFVGGATIRSATLHNAKWVREQELHIGDTVMVSRRGDCIPRVESPLVALRPADAVPYEPPTTCPKCGEDLDTTSSVLWRCLTPECSVSGKIAYAASRSVLDIDGLATGTVDALVECDLVNNLADLFALTVEQVAAVKIGTTEAGADRLIGTVTATRIVNGIAAAKAQPLNRVITALGIRKMGGTFGRRLAARFGSMDALRAASMDDLVNSGIGGLKDGRAAYLHAGLIENAEIIDRLAAAGLSMEAERAFVPVGADGNVGELPLAGQTIVISGSLPGYTRTTGQEAIERLGGKASSSVSASTSALVTSETTTSKAVKAAALGVKIIDPVEFAALLASHGA